MTGVVALRHRIKKLVHADRLLFRENACESLRARSSAESVNFAASLIMPSAPSFVRTTLRVVCSEPRSCQQGRGILNTHILVSLRVRIDLFARKRLARLTFLPVGSPIRAVKSPIRKITVWPSCWKWRQLAHQHGVAEVQIGSGGVETGLDAQRLAGGAESAPGARGGHLWRRSRQRG